jgi:hypothetical protein
MLFWLFILLFVILKYLVRLLAPVLAVVDGIAMTALFIVYIASRSG